MLAEHKLQLSGLLDQIHSNRQAKDNLDQRSLVLFKTALLLAKIPDIRFRLESIGYFKRAILAKFIDKGQKIISHLETKDPDINNVIDKVGEGLITGIEKVGSIIRKD